jgi:hypothetical protein
MMRVRLTGGKRFEAAVKEIAGRLSNPGTLRVGFLENATYPDGKYVAEVAAYNEFGHNIVREGKVIGYCPPRPFFRNMIAKESKGWPAAVAKQLKLTNYDPGKALERSGLGIKGQLQQSIKDTNEPPLAASTIARKGFDKPLIDTGHMFNSVDFEVKK